MLGNLNMRAKAIVRTGFAVAGALGILCVLILRGKGGGMSLRTDGRLRITGLQLTAEPVHKIAYPDAMRVFLNRLVAFVSDIKPFPAQILCLTNTSNEYNLRVDFRVDGGAPVVGRPRFSASLSGVRLAEEPTMVVWDPPRNAGVLLIHLTAAATLEAEDIGNWAQFAQGLRNPRDPVSGFLREKLEDSAGRELAEWIGPMAPAKDLRDHIIGNVNLVILGPSIWRADRFPRIQLAERTRFLLQQSGRGLPEAQLNRSLLDDAYRTVLKPAFSVRSRADLNGKSLLIVGSAGSAKIGF